MSAASRQEPASANGANAALALAHAQHDMAVALMPRLVAVRLCLLLTPGAFTSAAASANGAQVHHALAHAMAVALMLRRAAVRLCLLLQRLPGRWLHISAPCTSAAVPQLEHACYPAMFFTVRGVSLGVLCASVPPCGCNMAFLHGFLSGS